MRRKQAEDRQVEADPLFEDEMVAKFVNHLMRDGKKSVARKIVYGAFDQIEEWGDDEGLDVFKAAVENVSPLVEVRSRRVGGATYQVPMEVRPERRKTLAYRWIIEAARSRRTKSMMKALAEELVDASNEEGRAVRKKDETHRMAEANKAFAHFRI